MSAQSNESDRSLQQVLDLCGHINAERELPKLLELIAQEGAKILDCERVTIFLLDRERCELISQVTLDGEKIRLDARLGIAGACALTGQMINIQDAQQDNRFYSAIDARTSFQTRSVLAIPLKNPAGDVSGTFQCLNKRHGGFGQDDEQTAQTLATQAAIAIETANLVHELKQQRTQLEVENTQLWKEVEGRFSTQRILGTSDKIQLIVRLIDQIRDSSVDVLITGESGTGKELVAKAIHYNSPRARRPFIAINCAAIPDALLESELFGHVKGAFTDAKADKPGLFEEASGGTLFLDEIGELPLTLQAKLLRVIQEKEIRRVGATRSITVDVRMIAATNANLEHLVREKRFRADLYFRLKVVTIHTPPLRELQEDLPQLANAFLEKYCETEGKEVKRLGAGALRCLLRYDWPGNVRELENEIRRLIVLTRKTTIVEEDLSETIRDGASQGREVVGRRSLKQTVEELEKRLIVEALQRCRQNQVQAAKWLGLSRQGLIQKMHRYGVKVS